MVQAVVLPTVLPNDHPVPALAPGQAGWRWAQQQLARLSQEKTLLIQQPQQRLESQAKTVSSATCQTPAETAMEAVSKAGLAYMERNPQDTQCFLQQALQFDTLSASQRQYIELSLAFLADPERFDGVRGVYLMEVEPTGTAARHGLQEGDVLLRYHNQPVQEPEEVARMIPTMRGAPSVAVDLIRKGERLTMYLPGGASLSATGSPLVAPWASAL
jgi:hypothetical protein